MFDSLVRLRPVVMAPTMGGPYVYVNSEPEWALTTAVDVSVDLWELCGMATARNLNINQNYPVKAGPMKGQTVTVVDNTPVPDGQENQRKILVRGANESDEGGFYILPRLLDDGTVTPSEAAKVPAPHMDPVAVPITSTVPEALIEDNNPITDAMDDRLDMFRPDPKVVKEYVSRKLPGKLKDIDVLLRKWRNRENVLLVGDTQSGKTMVIRVIAVLAAEEMGLPKPFPIFTLSGSNGVTDFDLFGQPSVYTDPSNGAEHVIFLPGVVDLAARTGGFLELDETNMFDDRTVSALNSLTDDRRSFVNRQKAVKVPGDGYMPEIVKAHENFWCVGSYNDGYRGAGQLQEAFANRFAHLPWDYDEEVEKKLIKSEVIRNTVASSLRNARENNQIGTPVGVRALQQLEKDALEVGVEFALWAFLGMFPGRDRERVGVILTDRSVETLLTEEVSAMKQKAQESQ